MDSKKILLLGASGRSNYLRISQAIKRTADKMYPDSEVMYIDTFTYGSNIFKKHYVDNYIELLKKHPALWGYSYDKLNKSKKSPKIPEARFIFQEFFVQKLMDKISQISPDIIICTHFLPAEQLNRYKGKKLARKYCSVIPDFDVHWLWVQSNIDVICVATKEASLRLVERGIPEKRIHVTGIPVSPTCMLPECVHHESTYREFKLIPEKFKIALLDSGYGIGPVEYIAEELLLFSKGKIQVIVYETDKVNKHKLQKLLDTYPEHLRIVPNAKRIETVLAASDLVIADPNGYICSECLAMEVPLLSINPMPGYEERNSDYLIENGVAFKVYDLTGLFVRVNKLMNDSELRDTIKLRARKIAKPNAAKDILKIFYDEEKVK